MAGTKRESLIKILRDCRGTAWLPEDESTIHVHLPGRYRNPFALTGATSCGGSFALVDSNRLYLRQWLPWLDANVAVSDTLCFIQSTQQQLADNSGFVAGIWYRDELTGVVGHNRIDWTNRIAFPGYWLAEKFQGKGIMTKSCRALVNHAFTELDINRIDIRCAVGNNKSRAIPERLNFRQEGTVRQAEWLYDKFVDHIVYGMLKAEWQCGPPLPTP